MKKLDLLLKNVDMKDRMEAQNRLNIGEQKSAISNADSPRKAIDEEASPHTLRAGNLEDLKTVNRIIRNPGSDGKPGSDEGKIDKLQGIDDIIRDQAKQASSRIPHELRMQAKKVCDDLDAMIKEKKDTQARRDRLVRNYIDGSVVEFDDADEHYLNNPETSALEKKRRRIVNEFE